jgi:hypothetical protein
MTVKTKDPGEILPYEFDFSDDATGVSNVVVTATSFSGPTDASPQSIISGAAQINGAVVLQQITGGQVGTTYKLRCQVDTADGKRLILPGFIGVQTA